MAATAITNATLTRNTWTAFPAVAASDATDGILITPSKPDGQLLIYCQNSDGSNAETVVIKGGYFKPFAAGDLSLSFAASAVKVIAIETGKYLQSSGKIKMTGSADVKVSVIELP